MAGKPWRGCDLETIGGHMVLGAQTFYEITCGPNSGSLPNAFAEITPFSCPGSRTGSMSLHALLPMLIELLNLCHYNVMQPIACLLLIRNMSLSRAVKSS